MAKKETKEVEIDADTTCIVHKLGTRHYEKRTLTKKGIIKEVLPDGKRV
jgi:hypothetical protein